MVLFLRAVHPFLAFLVVLSMVGLKILFVFDSLRAPSSHFVPIGRLSHGLSMMRKAACFFPELLSGLPVNTRFKCASASFSDAIFYDTLFSWGG